MKNSNKSLPASRLSTPTIPLTIIDVLNSMSNKTKPSDLQLLQYVDSSNDISKRALKVMLRLNHVVKEEKRYKKINMKIALMNGHAKELKRRCRIETDEIQKMKLSAFKKLKVLRNIVRKRMALDWAVKKAVEKIANYDDTMSATTNTSRLSN